METNIAFAKNFGSESIFWNNAGKAEKKKNPRFINLPRLENTPLGVIGILLVWNTPLRLVDIIIDNILIDTESEDIFAEFIMTTLSGC